MQGYVDYIENNPFYIREAWSIEAGKWVGPGRLQLIDLQKRILSHCLTPGLDGMLPYETILFGTIKKSGKSLIGASVADWYNHESTGGMESYILAADKDQAEGRILKDLKYHAKQYNIAHDNSDEFDDDDDFELPSRRGKKKKNPDEYVPIKITNYKLIYPNDSIVQAISSDFASNAGSRHGLTVWDELWTFRSEAFRTLWDELTPIPTIPNSLRFVATYAGFIGESSLLWDLYLASVGKEEHPDGRGEKIPGLEDLPCYRSGNIFCYWNHDPIMPWQTPKYYQSQMDTMRAKAYLRVHENRWVTSHETFIPMSWWERAESHYTTQAHMLEDHPYRDYPVYLGIDGAILHDSMSLVAVIYDPELGIVAQVGHKIWTPVGDGTELDPEDTLIPAIKEFCTIFNVRKIGFDPAIILAVMVKLTKAGYPTVKFDQTVANMTKAGQNFYDLLRNSRYYTYPDELAKVHIQNTVAQEENRGYRLVKDTNRKGKPMDFSIGAAIASYLAVSDYGGGGEVNVKIEAPFADMRQGSVDSTQKWLPPALRD